MTSFMSEDLKGFEKIKARFAVAMAQLTRRVLRILKKGGTALPGKIALKIDPQLLKKLTQQRKVVLVTGTNGKTTTVKLLTNLFEASGHTVITNPSGANMTNGLTGALIENIAILKKAAKTVLILEIDEAYFAKLAGMLQPEICIITNFFRDQLDRYGELSHTRDLIQQGILQASSAQIILCADDSLAASLAKGIEERCWFFGAANETLEPYKSDAVMESTHCYFCGERYHYHGIAYGHLGDFFCSNCGFAKPKMHLSFSAIQQEPGGKQRAIFNWQAQIKEGIIGVPGFHNLYNAAAALTATLVAGEDYTTMVNALASTSAAFGRMERFQVGDKEVCLILVKNPVGMTQTLRYVQGQEDIGGLMLMLNAKENDSRDVSWIWDVDMEHTLPPVTQLEMIGISGERCADMALRLYYADWPSEKIVYQKDQMLVFDEVLKQCPSGKCLYLLPNYTTMLAIREQLANRYHLKGFWEKR